MRSMFSYCSSLSNLNLSNFNTQNVTDMSRMFSYCKSLTNIDLSNFNTQNVTNMSFMFSWCSDELKLKIRSQYKNFEEMAFDDDIFDDVNSDDDN